jgi:hypothetical protein
VSQYATILDKLQVVLGKSSKVLRSIAYDCVGLQRLQVVYARKAVVYLWTTDAELMEHMASFVAFRHYFKIHTAINRNMKVFESSLLVEFMGRLRFDNVY